MKKTSLLAAIAIAVSYSVAHASTITFGAVPTARTVVNALDLSLTNVNSLVLAGTFANVNFTLDSALTVAENFSAVSLLGGWEQFGVDTETSAANTGVTSTLGISAAGKIGGAITDNTSGATKATFFNDEPLYLWVFNASTIGEATQAGLFRATTATVPWIFPVNGAGVGDSRTFSTTGAAAAEIQSVGGSDRPRRRT